MLSILIKDNRWIISRKPHGGEVDTTIKKVKKERMGCPLIACNRMY